LIRAVVRSFGKTARDFKLHTVEEYGIWIEAREYSEELLTMAGMPTAPKHLVVFVPWSEVTAVFFSPEVFSL
jgi:hypothetical protein